ncbi:MAG: hypothetical protein KAT05_13595, partial [Spirochaetes bacterium]|nr:hypothetical protein [Spirochaetota bacterium]
TVPVNEKNLKKWRKWAKKDKKVRVILFCDKFFKKKSKELNSNSYYSNINFKDIKITRNNDSLLEGVKKLHINTNAYINSLDKKLFKNNKLFPIIKYKGKTLIAKELLNDGEIIYISDIFIFSDKSILKYDNAVFLNNLLKDYHDRPIVLDNVYEKEKKIKEHIPFFLFMGNFKLIFIQIIIILILFFLTFIKRFGHALDKEKFERRSLLRHLEAVGYFFEKAKDPIVYVKILDKYFLFQLKKLIKIRTSLKIDIINEIKKRYVIDKNDEEIFLLNNRTNIARKEVKREKFIRKLKGI